jgi:hypothetical protein
MPGLSITAFDMASLDIEDVSESILGATEPSLIPDKDIPSTPKESTP